jgi:hypothetical protein
MHTSNNHFVYLSDKYESRFVTRILAGCHLVYLHGCTLWAADREFNSS